MFVVFNREQANHDLCVQAHKQYTDLVDTLIESYCLDVGISTKDLVEALKLTDQNTKLNEKEKHLLEPVVAAQDFNVFVPLMVILSNMHWHFLQQFPRLRSRNAY